MMFFCRLTLCKIAQSVIAGQDAKARLARLNRKPDCLHNWRSRASGLLHVGLQAANLPVSFRR